MMHGSFHEEANTATSDIDALVAFSLLTKAAMHTCNISLHDMLKASNLDSHFYRFIVSWYVVCRQVTHGCHDCQYFLCLHTTCQNENDRKASESFGQKGQLHTGFRRPSFWCQTSLCPLPLVDEKITLVVNNNIVVADR